MAGFTFTQSTKLLLKNLDKASPDEIHDMIDKEFEDKTLADKFLGEIKNVLYWKFDSNLYHLIFLQLSLTYLKMSSISVFSEAKIDGPCFLRLSQEEKNDLLPGICNMMARRRLTDMIDYAKVCENFFLVCFCFSLRMRTLYIYKIPLVVCGTN